MKKFIAIILLFVLVLSCCACNKEETKETAAPTEPQEIDVYADIDETVPQDGVYKIHSIKGLQNMAVIVDTNHANSNKCYLEQPRIVKEVLHSCRQNAEINSMVKGFMIESYLEDGAQKVEEGIYGKSITDPCLGWEKTEKLIYQIADQL